MERSRNRGSLVHGRLECPVVRVSRDILLSYAVFDLTAPLTVTMPDAKGRFQPLRAINEDHYIVSNTCYAGAHVFAKEKVGTQYTRIAGSDRVEAGCDRQAGLARLGP